MESYPKTTIDVDPQTKRPICEVKLFVMSIDYPWLVNKKARFVFSYKTANGKEKEFMAQTDDIGDNDQKNYKDKFLFKLKNHLYIKVVLPVANRAYKLKRVEILNDNNTWTIFNQSDKGLEFCCHGSQNSILTSANDFNENKNNKYIKNISSTQVNLNLELFSNDQGFRDGLVANVELIDEKGNIKGPYQIALSKTDKNIDGTIKTNFDKESQLGLTSWLISDNKINNLEPNTKYYINRIWFNEQPDYLTFKWNRDDNNNEIYNRNKTKKQIQL
ncbi:conserved hypothetical protein [Ureaplasma urealyticum serovar 2 str. ATCC 27814]|nr:conserved hypothetical protein [Ureaplasma urealyticum serovar 2 str. ATCC 27814]